MINSFQKVKLIFSRINPPDKCNGIRGFIKRRPAHDLIKQRYVNGIVDDRIVFLPEPQARIQGSQFHLGIRQQPVDTAHNLLLAGDIRFFQSPQINEIECSFHIFKSVNPEETENQLLHPRRSMGGIIIKRPIDRGKNLRNPDISQHAQILQQVISPRQIRQMNQIIPGKINLLKT